MITPESNIILPPFLRQGHPQMNQREGTGYQCGYEAAHQSSEDDFRHSASP